MTVKDREFIKFLIMVAIGIAGFISFLLWITGGL